MRAGSLALACRAARWDTYSRKEPWGSSNGYHCGTAIHVGQANSHGFTEFLSGSVRALLINEFAEEFTLIIILRLTLAPVHSELMIGVGAAVIDNYHQFIGGRIVRNCLEVIGTAC